MSDASVEGVNHHEKFVPPHLRPHKWDVPPGVAAYIKDHGLNPTTVFYNAAVASLYEAGLRHEPGTAISETGALIAFSGAKTGRSPADKRIVEEETTKGA